MGRAADNLVWLLGRRGLRKVAALGYRVIAGAGSRYLTAGNPGAAVYVRGGLGTDDFVPGISDIDLAIVFPSDDAGRRGAAEGARARWQNLRRRIPLTRALLDWPRIYDETELRSLAGSSAFTYGIDQGGAAAYLGERANLDGIRTLERPGLQGTTADWRPYRGPDRRPPEPEQDPQARRVAAWLELVYWWRLLFRFCVDPTTPRAATFGAKLVAEPARIWLWLGHGERTATRVEALRRAAALLPDEETALRRARELLEGSAARPEPPLGDFLPASVRLSQRIATTIGAEVAAEPVTVVRLTGTEPSELIRADVPGALPLVDWRAVACPDQPEESFVVLEGDVADPVALAAAATLHPRGTYPTLRADGLIALPAVDLGRTRLRALKCAVTDPVPFAVLEGAKVAVFPDVRGWSARDMALRALAEHRAGLASSSAAEARRGEHLGLLFSAARAALLHASIEENEPELCLSVSATARRLDSRLGSNVAQEAAADYRAFAERGAPPPPKTVAAIRDVVLGLRAYQADDPFHH